MNRTWQWVIDMSVWMGVTPPEFWKLVVGSLVPLGAIIAAFIGIPRLFRERRKDREVRESELESRRSELAWRRTELINELARRFDDDAAYRVALEALAQFRHGATKPDLQVVLEPNTRSLTEEQLELRLAFDRYLDFFDRLYTLVYITEVLTLGELLAFSAYVEEVADIPELSRYASDCGYGVVLTLAGSFQAVRPLYRIREDVTATATQGNRKNSESPEAHGESS